MKSTSVAIMWPLAVLLTATFLAGLAPSVFAQGWGLFNPEAGWLPPISNLDLRALNLRTSASVGYQRMGVNFNLQAMRPIFGNSNVDLALTADIWVGSLGVELDFHPAFSLFLNATANAPKSVAAVTAENPLPPVYYSATRPWGSATLSTIPPVTWPGSILEWWLIDGGVLYQYSSGIGVLAGLRRDHLSFQLAQDNSVNVPLVLTAEADYGGDFLEKLWVPYLGIQMNGPNYRARFIWSPFVSVSLKAPLSFATIAMFLDLPPIPPDISQSVEGFRYTVFTPGALFEANFEYNQQFGRMISLGLWGKAGWFKLSGNGNMADEAKAPGFDLSASDSGTATLTRNTLAGGVFAEVKF